MNAGQWIEYFATEGITTKQPPFGMRHVDKPTQEDIAKGERDIAADFNGANFSFPDSYTSFCLTHGPGTLGRVRIFAPCGIIGFPDLRFHYMRLQDKFRNPEFKVVHSFPLRDLVIFANDVEEDLWFGWLANSTDTTIYCVDETEKAPPPVKVANSFEEFVSKVCLGNLMRVLKLKKYQEPRDDQDGNRRRRAEEEDEDSDDDDDDDEEDEEYLLSLRSFRPFPGSKSPIPVSTTLYIQETTAATEESSSNQEARQQNVYQSILSGANSMLAAVNNKNNNDDEEADNKDEDDWE